MKRLRATRRCSRPPGDARPLGRFDDARDHVERPCPVDAAAVGVHGERDAHRLDVGGRRRLTAAQLVELESMKDIEQFPCRRAWRAVLVAQLVPRGDARGHQRATLREDVGETGSRTHPVHERRRPRTPAALSRRIWARTASVKPSSAKAPIQRSGSITG